MTDATTPCEVVGQAAVATGAPPDGGLGAWGGPIRVRDCTFRNNEFAAVRAYEATRPSGRVVYYLATVRGSTFSGNGVDLQSYRRPAVSQSSCTTSEVYTSSSNPFGPYSGTDEWDVCQ